MEEINIYAEALGRVRQNPDEGKPYDSIRVYGDTYSITAWAAKQITNDRLPSLLCVFDSEGISHRKWKQMQGGFSVRTEPGQINGTTMLCIDCEDKAYEIVFFKLCSEICSIIAEEEDVNECISNIHNHIMQHVLFFEARSAGLLSADNQVGLYGELLVLECVIEQTSIDIGVSSWRGSQRAAQDFQFANPSLAIEVKSSRANDRGDMSITNIQQLDAHSIETLYLTYVRLSANPTSGQTLPELVDLLRDKLVGDIESLEKFNQSLTDRKYFDAHSEEYIEKYDEIERLNFLVEGESFPRILESQLIDGVKKVAYRISTDACMPFQKSHEEFIKAISGI